MFKKELNSVYRRMNKGISKLDSKVDKVIGNLDTLNNKKKTEILESFSESILKNIKS